MMVHYDPWYVGAISRWCGSKSSLMLLVMDRRGSICGCWWSIRRLWCSISRGWCRMVWFWGFLLALIFTLAAENPALVLFLLLFEVRVYPDILVGSLWYSHQLPFLNMCHYRLLDKLGWWWLQHLSVFGVRYLDIFGLVHSDRFFDCDFTVSLDGHVFHNWGPKSMWP